MSDKLPRPRPRSIVEDNSIFDRIREIAKQENRQPTIERLGGRFWKPIEVVSFWEHAKTNFVQVPYSLRDYIINECVSPGDIVLDPLDELAAQAQELKMGYEKKSFEVEIIKDDP